jgi:hypothetical protein
MRLLSHEVGGEDRLAVAVGAERAIEVTELLADGPWTMGRLLQDLPRVSIPSAPWAHGS